MTELEKHLSKSTAILPDKYITRGDQLKKLFNQRWQDLDLEYSIREQIDEISLFISLYHEATGKTLISTDAKQFLDDLIIYSESEIKSRLKSENINQEYIEHLMEIIKKYIHKVNISNSKVEILDEFDIDFDNLSGDEK